MILYRAIVSYTDQSYRVLSEYVILDPELPSLHDKISEFHETLGLSGGRILGHIIEEVDSTNTSRALTKETHPGYN